MRRSPRKAVAAGALVATAAFLAVGIPSTSATADTAPSSAPRAGALEVKLTPAQRAKLLKTAHDSRAVTAGSLALGSKEQLVVKDVLKDADGTVHTRYERTYAGLPVLGGDLVVHTPASGTNRTATFNTRAAVEVPSTTAQVAGSAAEATAVKAAKALKAEKPAAEGARKVVWAGSGKPTLAWETVVSGLQHDDTPSRLHVITDAATGKKLFQYEDIKTGTGNSQYSGTVTIGTTLSGSTYQMNDTTRGASKTYNLNNGTSGTGTLFTDADDTWGTGSGSNTQTAAVDAHFGAQKTWDYYKNTHSRNGIKNDGVAAYSRVHYSTAYVNAFWDDSCFCMTYGDGSGGTHALTSLDVAGHEMTHGVTSNTADLTYSGESGGLNEATSDIFGTAVEFYAANSSDVGDYLIGEKIDINGDGTPLRYMDEPDKDGSSYDSWFSGIGNQDVHHSSGPANHFFYLLSEGSGSKTINGVTYNSPTSDGLAVTGIGRAAAEKIWYRALTTYFTSSTNYAGARTGTLSATADLYGSTSTQYAAVQDAWAAVNVGSRSGGGGGGGGDGTAFESTTDVTIPDAGAAVYSNITVSGITGSAPSDLSVAVNIVHTWRGDLVIDLVAPDGTAYRLKNSSSSDSADNVVATYTVDADAETANGTWRLKVQDVYSADTGYINSWKLTF